MCRWLAYIGTPIFMDELVTRPAHSLVEQSLNAKFNWHEDGSIWTTNGDGFGVGWYHDKPKPGLFKDAMPAWNDENLHEICSQTKAHIFFSHIRASTHGQVQRNNSHPFKFENWLFQHNGDVHHFDAIKRAARFEIAPEFYNKIEGTTDSETLFYLTLTNGLRDNAKEAFEKSIAFLEQAQKQAGVPVGLNLSCAVSDGNKVYTIRYSSGDEPARSQFYSTDMTCAEDLTDESTNIPDGGTIIVSEPLDREDDKWHEVPKNTFMEIAPGKVQSYQMVAA